MIRRLLKTKNMTDKNYDFRNQIYSKQGFVLMLKIVRNFQL